MGRETLSSRVSRELIRSIVSGRFGTGELLPTEEQLGSEFGVSRSVVREAMRSVTGIGMAKSRQGQGTVVLPAGDWNNFSSELIRARRDTNTLHEVLAEVLELRTLIEVQAAGLAAERANDENLDRMAITIDSLGTATTASAFITADIAFHDEIFIATSNHLIVSLFDVLRPVLHAAREIGIDAQLDALGKSASTEEHRVILRTIRAGGADAARNAMREHLALASERTRSVEAVASPDHSEAPIRR